MRDWQALRAEFPLLDRCIYLNACSLGPLSRPARAAVNRYLDTWDTQGTPAWFTSFLPTLARLRARVGDLLGAPPGSVALAPSVSVATTTAASALLPLALAEGRNRVVIGDLDFPTIGHQFLSRPEVEVVWVRSPDGIGIPVSAFAAAVDSRTALVATTHLYYTTGFLQDARALADLAHAAGAFCMVDGYQTVGCVPIDVEALDCDIYVAGALKWLSGGPGTAFLYARPSLVPSLRPVGTGWFATADPFGFVLESLDFAEDARRLETGTWAVPSHYAALASLELILDQVGVEAICERLRDFTDRILSWADGAGLQVFTPRDRALRCGIVTLACEQPAEVEAALHADGVIVDSRPGRVRLSPHWCLTEAELDRGLELVERRMREAVPV
jgi:selenocysteine lyase/cysteine desulfurase